MSHINLTATQYARLYRAVCLSLAVGSIESEQEADAINYFAGILVDENMCRHFQDICDVSIDGFWNVSPDMTPSLEVDILLPDGRTISHENANNALAILRSFEAPVQGMEIQF